MKYAVITVTENGTVLAEKLRAALVESAVADVDIYVKRNRHKALNNVQEFDKMRDLIEKIFYAYDALIFFTSTGIAVRMIAPYIVHKAKDPAVIVLDEQAHFAISLLSGHLGGANELTEKIAGILTAVPVITTATDANNITAPDVIAAKLKLMPYPLTHIKSVNAALVQGKKVDYYIDNSWNLAAHYQAKLQKLGFAAKLTTLDALAEQQRLQNTPSVLLSPQRQVLKNILLLTPRILVAGVGCRRGVSETLIAQAINEAKRLADYGDLQIKTLVSTVVKRDEQGLLDWAKAHGVQTHFYDNEVMRRTIAKYKLIESAFVKKQIGIGNVCEAAILSYNETAKIILPKTKFEKVTVSLAWE